MKILWEDLWSECPRTGAMAGGRALTICIGPFIFSIGFAKREPPAPDMR